MSHQYRGPIDIEAMHDGPFNDGSHMNISGLSDHEAYGFGDVVENAGVLPAHLQSALNQSSSFNNHSDPEEQQPNIPLNYHIMVPHKQENMGEDEITMVRTNIDSVSARSSVHESHTISTWNHMQQSAEGRRKYGKLHSAANGPMRDWTQFGIQQGPNSNDGSGSTGGIGMDENVKDLNMHIANTSRTYAYWDAHRNNSSRSKDKSQTQDWDHGHWIVTKKRLAGDDVEMKTPETIEYEKATETPDEYWTANPVRMQGKKPVPYEYYLSDNHIGATWFTMTVTNRYGGTPGMSGTSTYTERARRFIHPAASLVDYKRDITGYPKVSGPVRVG